MLIPQSADPVKFWGEKSQTQQWCQCFLFQGSKWWKFPKTKQVNPIFLGPGIKSAHIHFILPFLFAFIKNQPFLAKKIFHLEGFKENIWNWDGVALEKHLENPRMNSNLPHKYKINPFWCPVQTSFMSGWFGSPVGASTFSRLLWSWEWILPTWEDDLVGISPKLPLWDLADPYTVGILLPVFLRSKGWVPQPPAGCWELWI